MKQNELRISPHVPHFRWRALKKIRAGLANHVIQVKANFFGTCGKIQAFSHKHCVMSWTRVVPSVAHREALEIWESAERGKA